MERHEYTIPVYSDIVGRCLKPRELLSRNKSSGTNPVKISYAQDPFPDWQQ